jgi:hypothetical protein
LVGIDYPNLNKEPQPKLRFVWDRNLIVVVLPLPMEPEGEYQTFDQECLPLVRPRLPPPRGQQLEPLLALQASGNLPARWMPTLRSM